MMMKILHATARYYPAIGGVEDFVGNLCEQLVSMSHQVDAVALDFATPGKNINGSFETENICGVKLRRFKTRYFFGISYPCSLSMFNQVFRYKGDIIHGHCFWYFPGDIAVFTGAMKRKPYFYNPYYYPAHTSMRKLYMRLMKRLITRANRVIAISRFEYGLLQNLGVPSKKLEIIPPGMKLNLAIQARENIFSKVGLNNKRIILSINRLSVEKHVEVLIHAAPGIIAQVPDAHFVVIGPDFGRKNYLIQEIKKSKLENSFTFLGALEKDKVFSAYQNADLFCHTADGELFGITLMEALACGLPTIATDVEAVPEIIINEKHGLLYPFGDSETLAKQAIMLLKDKGYAEQLAENGKKFVDNNFSIQSVTDRYISLYTSL